MKEVPLKLCQIIRFSRMLIWIFQMKQNVQGVPILQLPVFLNKNIESRQFGAFEQVFKKYRFKVDLES